jgi:hypothetical protein
MYGPRDHEFVPDFRLEISSLADDDPEIETESRLRQTLQRRPTNRGPPSIELIPHSPVRVGPSRLQNLDGFHPAHCGEGIDALTLEIGGIIESPGVGRAARSP